MLRATRDYLQVVDPLAQGLATVAEIEARVVEIFQALSIQRSAGLLLAEALLELVGPYLTDGAYFIQHGNLREVMERTGVAPHIEGYDAYINAYRTEDLADLEGENSSFVQFGPDSDGSGPFESYRRYPDIIRGQVDARVRQLQRFPQDALSDEEFNSFDEWLYPLIAAFHDPGDPLRPQTAGEDEMGGVLIAVQSTDPDEAYQAYQKLKGLFYELKEDELVFTDLSEDLAEDLGWDTISQWELKESLQWNSIQSNLRQHLILRYSTSPDFQRVSTADLLPALGDFLLDASNLAEFAGLPFPENFSLLNVANLLADKVRNLLLLLDRSIELLTKVSDILSLTGVWRLWLPPEEGGVSRIIERIHAAPKDDTVRLTHGTTLESVSPEGSPLLTSFSWGRITSIPDDPAGTTGYVAQDVGDWMLDEELASLAANFTTDGKTGFEYSAPKVYRSGELMRRSHANKLKAAFAGVEFASPGNMFIYGVGIFFVKGALGRLLEGLFGPEEVDWAEWLGEGPPALPILDGFLADVSARPVNSPGMITPSLAQGSGDDVRSDFGGPDSEQDQVGGAPEGAQSIGRVDRHGSSRSFEVEHRAWVSTADNALQRVWLRGESLISLGGATMALGEEPRTWGVSDGRLVPTLWQGHPPHGPVPYSEAQSAYEGLAVEAYTVGPVGSLGNVSLPLTGYSAIAIEINPGGTSVTSADLVTQLAALSFPTGNEDARWYLDLEVSYAEDSVLRYCRVEVEQVVGVDQVWVYPALPCAPLLTSNVPSRAILHVKDTPTLTLLPDVPGDDADVGAADAHGVVFDIASSWFKRSGARTYLLNSELPLTLQAISGHHIVDVDTEGWGNIVPVALEPVGLTGKISVESGEYGPGPIDLRSSESWPGGHGAARDATVEDEEVSLTPFETSSRWSSAVAASNPFTSYASRPVLADTYDPPFEKHATNQHWKVLSVCASRMVRIPCGDVGDIANVYLRPSQWDYLLFKDGDTYHREKLDLLVSVPDDVAGQSVVSDRFSWEAELDAGALAAFSGESWFIVADIGAATDVGGAEVAYGRSRPWAMFVPWGHRSAVSADKVEEGDELAVSCGPSCRLGVPSAWSLPFGGTDPASTPSILTEPIAVANGSLAGSLRANKAGLIALTFTSGQSGWTWPRGNYYFLEGRTHRVILNAGDTELTWLYQEIDLEDLSWNTRMEVVTKHPAKEDKWVIVLQSFPITGRMDLLISEWDGAAWVEVSSETVTVLPDDDHPAVYPLQGMISGSGGWRVGRSARESSILSNVVRLLWDTNDSYHAGTPPIGYGGMTFVQVDVESPTEILNSYR